MLNQLQEIHLSQIADVFSLLSDATRLKVLIVCLHEYRSVGEIAQRLKISQPLASHHLRLLKSARLVRNKRNGKHVFYTASDHHVQQIVEDMLHHYKEPMNNKSLTKGKHTKTAQTQV